MNDPTILVKNRNEMVEEMQETYGYLFCQHCEKNQCGYKFEVHHIIFRSEAPDHEHLHSKKNLIIVGSNCHQWFHQKKDRRNYLIEKRGLYELFGPIYGYEQSRGLSTMEGD